MLERFQNEFLDYKGLGISVLEMSHRQPESQELTNRLLSDFRKLMKIPDNFHILLQRGGTTQQFSAVPLNLTGHVYGDEKLATANYLITG